MGTFELLRPLYQKKLAGLRKELIGGLGLGGFGVGLLWDYLRFLYSLCKCVLLRNPHGAYRVS